MSEDFSKSESYQLHIHAKRPALPGAASKRAGGARRWKNWLFEQVKVLAVSAIIFAVAFVGLNWSAIQTNALHYYQKWSGYESPLTAVTQEPKVERLRLASLNDDQSAPANGLIGGAVPRLNIAVAPPDARIVIPRINKNVPIVGVNNENLIARDWENLEKDIQQALQSGVVHYPGTALPGESGNVVLTGHSSYYEWNAGRFKDVFALLHDVEVGDKIVFYYNQRKYTYAVFDIRVVKPEHVDVLADTSDDRLTLITCTPIGTNAKRLVVSAKRVE